MLKLNLTKEEKTIIFIDSISSLTYADKQKIFDEFENIYDIISSKTAKETLNEILEKDKVDLIEKKKTKKYCDEILNGLEKRDIIPITFLDERYPDDLKVIDTPPFVLYCKGNLDLLRKEKFSVVGSRKMPEYEMQVAERIVNTLSRKYVIVTGLAEGGDTSAIKGALPSKNVISVLAYGYDYVYPTLNKHLLEKVMGSGLVITEYFYDVKPTKYNFPIRNRIIAALSFGTLVVSAGNRSGALITASKAIEYGKEVYAFPYGIGISAGEGCNKLIKDGAYLVTSADDVLASSGDVYKEIDLSLDETNEMVYKLILEKELHFDDLVLKTGLDTDKLTATLTELEIEGLILKTKGNYYKAF